MSPSDNSTNSRISPNKRNNRLYTGVRTKELILHHTTELVNRALGELHCLTSRELIQDFRAPASTSLELREAKGGQ